MLLRVTVVVISLLIPSTVCAQTIQLLDKNEEGISELVIQIVTGVADRSRIANPAQRNAALRALAPKMRRPWKGKIHLEIVEVQRDGRNGHVKVKLADEIRSHVAEEVIPERFLYTSQIDLKRLNGNIAKRLQAGDKIIIEGIIGYHCTNTTFNGIVIFGVWDNSQPRPWLHFATFANPKIKTRID